MTIYSVDYWTQKNITKKSNKDERSDEMTRQVGGEFRQHTRRIIKIR